jgi:hypothetical protein
MELETKLKSYGLIHTQRNGSNANYIIQFGDVNYKIIVRKKCPLKKFN